MNRTYTSEEHEQYIHQPNIQIRENFHFMIFGLDKSTYTVRDIYQEIYNKLTTSVGSLQMQNIMLLDNESLLADIFTFKTFSAAKNLNQNLIKMGRVACVKMDNILDALCLITKEVKITLPLTTGNQDEPIIYPSKFLLDYLSNYSPEKTQLDVRKAGKVRKLNLILGVCFSKLNKEIEILTYNLTTIKEGDEGKKKKKGHKLSRKDKSLEKKIKK